MNNRLYGTFTSDGTNKVLDLGVEIQGFRVINATQAADTNNGYGYLYEWSASMGTSMYTNYHPAADATAASDVVANSFTQFDSSNYSVGANVTATAGTNVVGPRISTATTTNLYEGCVVRLNSSGFTNLNGVDFTIDTIAAGVSFDLANDLATAPGRTAETGATGPAGVFYYQLVAPNREIYDIIYPSARVISNITQATSAVVTTLVDSGHQIGDYVKFYVPSSCGMTELNGQTGRVTAVSTAAHPYTFTVDIDTSAYTAFQFPVYNATSLKKAYVIPAGDTYTVNSVTGDLETYYGGAISRRAFRGVILRAGTAYPAGNDGDTIHWQAWKAATTY